MAVVSYWRKYVHKVLVNRLGGLSLLRKSVVRLTGRPDMTLDVCRGRKTTMQQQQQHWLVCYSSIEATCPSIPAALFAFRLCLFVLFLLFGVVLSGEPKQKQGRGVGECKLVQAPPPPPVVILLTVPRRLFFFGSLVILDEV